MRKTLGISFAATVLALTSACGGSGDGELTPTGGSSSSPAKAAEQASTDGELTRDNFVERLSAAQLDAGSAHMEMGTAMGAQDMTLQGDVRMAEDIKTSQSHLTMDLGPMKMDLRMVDGIMYLNMGAMSQDKYLKIDLTDPDSPLAQQYGSMADQADPSAQLETFRAALVEFDNQGDGGTIDGIDTTKIAMTLDTAKVLKDQGSKASGSMPEQLEYVVYVGADDLMRKMTMDIAGATTEITWTKWGEPVEVEAPAKDQIADADQMGAIPGFGTDSTAS